MQRETLLKESHVAKQPHEHPRQLEQLLVCVREERLASQAPLDSIRIEPAHRSRVRDAIGSGIQRGSHDYLIPRSLDHLPSPT